MGAHLSIEEGVLQLLEIRRVLLLPSCKDSVTHQMMRAYSRFVRRHLHDASAEPLALQLDARGRSEEFIPLLREFVENDQADCLVQLRALHGAQVSGASEIEELAAAERLLAVLRQAAIASARRGHFHAPSAIHFPPAPTDQRQ